MDLSMLIERARRILLEPRAEWRLIANESASMDGLRRSYLVVLAAIPAVLQFAKLSTAGASIVSGLVALLLSFALALTTMYVMAMIVNVLAPRFNSTKDRAQSRKTIAYAYTASLVASIAIVVPGRSWMVVVGAAALYAAYLLYLGLPATMKCPQENAAGYAVVTVIIAVVLGFVASMIGNMALGLGYGSSGSNPIADQATPQSRFPSFFSGSEPAEEKLAVAPESQDASARAPIEALPPERLKPFVPESLLGRQRTNLSVERVKEMGVETSRATAYFTDDEGRNTELQVTDLGQAKSLVGLASFVNVEEGESNAGASFERTYREAGDLVTEKWNDNTSTGEYSVVIADRFLVRIKGQAYNIDELKAVTAELDLATLEGLVGGGGRTEQ